MKSSKLLILALVVAVAAVTPAFAQSQSEPEVPAPELDVPDAAVTVEVEPDSSPAPQPDGVDDAEPLEESVSVAPAVAEAPAEAAGVEAQESPPAEPTASVPEAEARVAEPGAGADLSAAQPLPAQREPAMMSEAAAGEPLALAARTEGEAVPAALSPGSEWAPGESMEAPIPDASKLAGPLGAVGYDSEGRQGRVHIVAPADTLWDISSAYLGTPWVWPSIWKDNRDIENPHLIHPGDRIWITPSEMRRVSVEEADALLTNLAQEPAAAEEWVALEETFPAAQDELAPMPTLAPQELGTLQVSGLESVGLVSPEQMDSSASIVGRVPDRVMLAQEDDVYIGLGESDLEVGDQFTIIRSHERVFDPDTGELLGYHVEMLGYVEVEETFPETARASIRMSSGEIELEDRLVPREPVPDGIPMQPSPDGVEGKVSFFPKKRVLMGFNDFVYLNRGALDGLEPGSPLEVYRVGYTTNDSARHQQVEVPDRVIARLVVLRADTEAAVAIVTHADGELELGDRFRGAR